MPKGSIDLGISPPPPLKLPIAQPPEKYDCELKTIVEDSTKSIDVPDDGLGALDIAESAYMGASLLCTPSNLLLCVRCHFSSRNLQGGESGQTQARRIIIFPRMLGLSSDSMGAMRVTGLAAQ